jgi:hypothetical protein
VTNESPFTITPASTETQAAITNDIRTPIQLLDEILEIEDAYIRRNAAFEVVRLTSSQTFGTIC